MDDSLPLEIALFIKEYYTDELFKNENLGCLTVKRTGEKDTEGNDLYHIEAGVYDEEIQKNINFFEFKNKVPDYLEIPQEIEIEKIELIPKTILIRAIKFEQYYKINKEDFVPNKIKVDIIQEDLFEGLSYNQKYGILEGGISAHHYNIPNYGTLGAVVKINNSSYNYIISNWHTFKGNIGRIGDEITQQSPKDGGKKNTHTIGKLIWYRLDQEMDAAIAKMNSQRIPKSGTKCFNINGLTNAKIGDLVKKCGRSSRLTNGKIVDIYCTARVRQNEYPSQNKILLFKNQIKIAPLINQSAMSQSGDSGSLLVNNTNMVCGLIFAGNSKFTLANHLKFNSPLKNSVSYKAKTGYSTININF